MMTEEEERVHAQNEKFAAIAEYEREIKYGKPSTTTDEPTYFIWVIISLAIYTSLLFYYFDFNVLLKEQNTVAICVGAFIFALLARGVIGITCMCALCFLLAYIYKK